MKLRVGQLVMPKEGLCGLAGLKKGDVLRITKIIKPGVGFIKTKRISDGAYYVWICYSSLIPIKDQQLLFDFMYK